MSTTIARILERIDMPDLVDRLGSRLPGADFTSLMLEIAMLEIVMLEIARLRARRVTPAAVLQQYRRDRFVGTSPVPLAAPRRVEDLALALLPAGTEALVLSPLMPLGGHAAVATVDQNKVVTTLRGTEVAADPTNGLALEAAHRRATASHDCGSVHFAASQRVVRAQGIGGSARRFAHFQLFGLVSAARDEGSLGFEVAAALRHCRFHVALARACDARDRDTGRGYYRHFCFKSYMRGAARTPEQHAWMGRWRCRLDRTADVQRQGALLHQRPRRGQAGARMSQP